MSEFENDSRRLVPAQGDAKGFDKTYQEKWLIYCPAITSDTLLYMVTALESYSLRSYAGRLGVITKGMHAEGAHTTSEFMRLYVPKKWKNTEALEIAVTKADKWAEITEKQWASFQKAQAGS